MIDSHQLFRLIKSLTKEEKRQFTLHLAYERHKEAAPVYVQLYEALERLEEYDESIFRKKYPKAAWARNFHHHKQYLYEYLLRLLTPNYVQRNQLAQVHWHCIQQEMLQERDLWELAKGHLQAAREIAERLDVRGVLPYLAARQLFNYGLYELKEAKGAERQARWEELAQNFDKQMQSSEQFFRFYKESLHLLFLQIGNYPSDILEQRKKDWQNLYEQLQKMPTTYPDSKNTQIMYWQLLSFLSQVLPAVPQKNYAVWGAELILSDTDFANAHPTMACSWLYNACVELLQREAQEEAEKLTERFVCFAQNCPHKAIQGSENRLKLLSARIYLGIKQRQWRSVKTLCAAESELLFSKEKALSVGLTMPILFDWGQACFLLGEEAEMLRAWSAFLDKEEQMYIWRKHAYLVYLLHLWRSEQWKMLQYRFSNAYRMLRKEQGIGDFERELFRFLRRSLRFPHRRKQALRCWQKALQSEDLYDKRSHALDFFDYRAALGEK